MHNEKIDISIVSPVYGKNLDLTQLYNRLKAVLEDLKLNFEIILVDDRSPDQSWAVIQSLSKHDPRVRGVRLSRNFGQHAAITAGLFEMRGRWCVVMDCDMQDRPEEIPHFYKKAREGFDVVVGARTSRTDGWLQQITSKLFYVVFNYLTGQKIDNNVANFGIYSSKVIQALKQYHEVERSFGLLIHSAGFSRAEIEIMHGMRLVGKSSYSFFRRLDLALGLILSHSNKPLKLAVFVGFLTSGIAFLCTIYLVCWYFFFDKPVSGWTSLIVSQFFLSGTIIGVLGMVGLYVSKTFDQVKGRPLYIVDNTTFER